MSTVILSHKVKDYAKWRPVFDSDIKRRKGAGFKNEKVFRASDDPNHVYIVAEVSDPSIFKSMVNDPDLAAIMEKAGVVSKPSAVVLNPA
jgi:hypothetical protein